MDSVSVDASFRDPVLQFSIFTENKVGRLSHLIKLFGSHQIHVMAITTLDTTDSAIIRLVVDDPEGARELFREQGMVFSESLILAVEMAGEREIGRILSALLEAEINIHYIYSFFGRPMGKCALAASIEDMELAVEALNKRNIKVLSQRDISR